jgi:hypothetical protein
MLNEKLMHGTLPSSWSLPAGYDHFVHAWNGDAKTLGQFCWRTSDDDDFCVGRAAPIPTFDSVLPPLRKDLGKRSGSEGIEPEKKQIRLLSPPPSTQEDDEVSLGLTDGDNEA